MTGRLDEIEAEALAGLSYRESEGQGPSGNELKSIESDLVLAFAELRAYRALRGGLMGLVLTYVEHHNQLTAEQIGRYYVAWICAREKL